jgi:hypothetical protein
VGCCECGDEPLGSGATELVSSFIILGICFRLCRAFSFMLFCVGASVFLQMLLQICVMPYWYSENIGSYIDIIA